MPGQLYRLAARESNALISRDPCSALTLRSHTLTMLCSPDLLGLRGIQQMRHIACLAALLFLSACSQENLLQKFSTPEDQATAKAYIDRLRTHDFDEIEKALDPSLKVLAHDGTLARMSDLIPTQEPMSMKVVGAQTFYTPASKMVNTTFEYNFGEKWLLVNVAVQEKNGTKTIVGFHIYPRSRSLESENHFTLSGKGTTQYLFLAMTISVALLTFYSLFACVRTKLPGRKWPWVLFILLGLGKAAVNWTTGQWGFMPVSIQLFSASAVAQFYGPWIVAFSAPVGAIWFLLYRRKLLASAAIS